MEIISNTAKIEVKHPQFKIPNEGPHSFLIFQEDGSRHPVHKLILAAQSEFFEGLFTFQDTTEYWLENPKREPTIEDPNPKNYLTKENFEIVLDTFYEIEPDLDEEKTREIVILANYFLADFLMEKIINTMVYELDCR